MSSEICHRKSKCLLLLSFMKFFDRNENKIDINLFITQFVIFFIFAGIVTNRRPGKYKTSLVS